MGLKNIENGMQLMGLFHHAIATSAKSIRMAGRDSTPCRIIAISGIAKYEDHSFFVYILYDVPHFSLYQKLTWMDLEFVSRVSIDGEPTWHIRRRGKSTERIYEFDGLDENGIVDLVPYRVFTDLTV